jgi:hypothetical protein
MNIMVNDACPNAEALSSITSQYRLLLKLVSTHISWFPPGLSTIFVVIPLSISPAIATSSFSLSIQSEILGGNLIWAVMFIVGAAGFVHSMTLTVGNNRDWREETPKNVQNGD